MNFDEFLIQEVQKNELLYNLSHPEYRNVPKKEITWLKIARLGNTRAIICKRRWKTLRDTYKKTKNQQTFENKRPWKYYNMMTFLDHVHSSRRNTMENNVPYKDETYKLEEPDSVEPANITIGNSSILDVNIQPMCGMTSGFTECPTSSYNYTAPINTDIDHCNTSTNEYYNSTLQLFGALARKVITSNLTPAQVTDIESCVSALVFQKLTQLMKIDE